jgi:DNA-binding response OmpR family regulator
MRDILVFHDDVSIAQMLHDICEMEGYNVARTRTVEETLEALRTAPHRLIGLSCSPSATTARYIRMGRSSRSSATIPTSMVGTAISPSTIGRSQRRR